jgi:hypothetical protein
VGFALAAEASSRDGELVSISVDRFSQDSMQVSSRKTRIVGNFTGNGVIMAGLRGISTHFVKWRETKFARGPFQETGCRFGGFKRQGTRQP